MNGTEIKVDNLGINQSEEIKPADTKLQGMTGTNRKV
jgi:hypothetical protein